jgi:hypothetical protein
MSYDSWPRWTGLSGRVPHLPAPPESKGLTLQYAEQMRHKVWREYSYNLRTGATDWDPETGTYPSDPTGCCRHKARWLQDKLGGVVLYGRRTDKAEPGLHAVLWIKRGEFGFIVDRDGIWSEQSAPWVCDGSHRAYKT